MMMMLKMKKVKALVVKEEMEALLPLEPYIVGYIKLRFNKGLSKVRLWHNT